MPLSEQESLVVQRAVQAHFAGPPAGDAAEWLERYAVLFAHDNYQPDRPPHLAPLTPGDVLVCASATLDTIPTAAAGEAREALWRLPGEVIRRPLEWVASRALGLPPGGARRYSEKHANALSYLLWKSLSAGQCHCHTYSENLSLDRQRAEERCGVEHQLKSWGGGPLRTFLFRATVHGALRLPVPERGLGERNRVNGFRHGMLAKVIEEGQLRAGPILRCGAAGCAGNIDLGDRCDSCDQRVAPTRTTWWFWLDGGREVVYCRRCNRKRGGCGRLYFLHGGACPGEQCGMTVWSPRRTEVWAPAPHHSTNYTAPGSDAAPPDDGDPGQYRPDELLAAVEEVLNRLQGSGHLRHREVLQGLAVDYKPPEAVAEELGMSPASADFQELCGEALGLLPPGLSEAVLPASDTDATSPALFERVSRLQADKHALEAILVKLQAEKEVQRKVLLTTRMELVAISQQLDAELSGEKAEVELVPQWSPVDIRCRKSEERLRTIEAEMATLHRLEERVTASLHEAKESLLVAEWLLRLLDKRELRHRLLLRRLLIDRLATGTVAQELKLPAGMASPQLRLREDWCVLPESLTQAVLLHLVDPELPSVGDIMAARDARSEFTTRLKGLAADIRFYGGQPACPVTDGELTVAVERVKGATTADHRVTICAGLPPPPEVRGLVWVLRELQTGALVAKATTNWLGQIVLRDLRPVQYWLSLESAPGEDPSGVRLEGEVGKGVEVIREKVGGSKLHRVPCPRCGTLRLMSASERNSIVTCTQPRCGHPFPAPPAPTRGSANAAPPQAAQHPQRQTLLTRPYCCLSCDGELSRPTGWRRGGIRHRGKQSGGDSDCVTATYAEIYGCPGCSSLLETPSQYCGQQASCPACGRAFRAPVFRLLHETAGDHREGGAFRFDCPVCGNRMQCDTLRGGLPTAGLPAACLHCSTLIEVPTVGNPSGH